MTTICSRFTSLSDTQLIAELRTLSEHERASTVQLIACLGEVDARRLYLAESCSSLFTYCTRVLHLSEHAAYGRIEAARAATRFPAILDRLAEGAVTLTTICLLTPHLTSENHLAVLDRARHKTKREMEEIVASLHPALPAPASVRKLPDAGAHAIERACLCPCPCCSHQLAIDRRIDIDGSAAAGTGASRICGADRASAVPDQDHRVEGNARQAAPCAGLDSARRTERRSGGDLRSRAYGAGARAGKDEIRGN